MSEKSKPCVGNTVTFKSGKSGTEFTAKVTGYVDQFVETTDDAGKVRKVRPGACTIVA